MKRRTFFTTLGGFAFGIPAIAAAPARHNRGQAGTVRGPFSMDANRVRFYSPAIDAPARILIAADTHLFTDDHRGIPFREFSGRMAGAYNATRHFETGEPTNPEESFERIISMAQESEVDLLALVGDIFSFPSEAAVEFASSRLSEVGVPYLYVAGNHDWHYEGMSGSLNELRATWIDRRLRPLYQGHNPLVAARDVNGIRFVVIDDSTYEILPEQLDFFRAQVDSGRPLVLMLHIPLFAPGRPVRFGCGHPDWGASADRNFELERRPRWPESGHSETTMAFYRAVFEASNLLGVFAGHIHRQSIDVIAGIPQVVADANAEGAFLDVEFLPMES